MGSRFVARLMHSRIGARERSRSRESIEGKSAASRWGVNSILDKKYGCKRCPFELASAVSFLLWSVSDTNDSKALVKLCRIALGTRCQACSNPSIRGTVRKVEYPANNSSPPNPESTTLIPAARVCRDTKYVFSPSTVG